MNRIAQLQQFVKNYPRGSFLLSCALAIGIGSAFIPYSGEIVLQPVLFGFAFPLWNILIAKEKVWIHVLKFIMAPVVSAGLFIASVHMLDKGPDIEYVYTPLLFGAFGVLFYLAMSLMFTKLILSWRGALAVFALSAISYFAYFAATSAMDVEFEINDIDKIITFSIYFPMVLWMLFTSLGMFWSVQSNETDYISDQ